ncbi:MAG: MBL fold metallo-hydrolase, partial [Dehalococcoidia bacterium]|nr:MBL fold metallo-hydrolase [Dehalococcoidia bacterium]
DLGGGVRVRVIFTPGHSSDSLCFYLEEEGVLFSGDTLLGSSTTTVSDLGAYRRSLRALLELPHLRVICPGHGPLVHDPRERLQSYIAHRDLRERQILEALRQRGPATSWELMLRLYPDVDRRLRRAADNNVRSHLRQLEQEGRLRLHPGKAKRPSLARQQRDVEHAAYRHRIVREARKLETQQRRAEIRAQENAPASEWLQPPRYELL